MVSDRVCLVMIWKLLFEAVSVGEHSVGGAADGGVGGRAGAATVGPRPPALPARRCRR